MAIWINAGPVHIPEQVIRQGCHARNLFTSAPKGKNEGGVNPILFLIPVVMALHLELAGGERRGVRTNPPQQYVSPPHLIQCRDAIIQRPQRGIPRDVGGECRFETLRRPGNGALLLDRHR